MRAHFIGTLVLARGRSCCTLGPDGVRPRRVDLEQVLGRFDFVPQLLEERLDLILFACSDGARQLALQPKHLIPRRHRGHAAARFEGAQDSIALER